MYKHFILLLLALVLHTHGNCQPAFSAPIRYGTGVPTAPPSNQGSRLYVDLMTGLRYNWSIPLQAWQPDAQGIMRTSGGVAPLAAPGYGQPPFAVNTPTPPTRPDLYVWVGPGGADWLCLSCGSGGGGAADGNGIYSGSDTVPAGTVARLEQDFAFAWADSSRAVEVVDSTKTFRVVGISPDTVTGLSAQVIYNLDNIGTGAYNLVKTYRVYTKVNGVYSKNYATISTVDNGSYTEATPYYYTVRLSWDSIPGAEYKVFVQDPDWTGWDFNAGWPTVNASIIDDNCCWDEGDIATTPSYSNLIELEGIVGPLTVNGPLNGQSGSFSNLAVNGPLNGQSGSFSNLTVNGPLNGQSGSFSNLTAQTYNSVILQRNGLAYVLANSGSNLPNSDCILIGDESGNNVPNGVVSSVLIGKNACVNSPYIFGTNAIGYNAGQNQRTADGGQYCNFSGFEAGANGNFEKCNVFGYQAGYLAGQTTGRVRSCNFFGQSAGRSANNALVCNFFGPNAGNDAANAIGCNFFGEFSGSTATNVVNSNFFGPNTGQNAPEASYSTFLGFQVGQSDVVNNNSVAGRWSVLIGRNLNTGGFPKSVALGGYIRNSAANQLNVGNVLYASNLYDGTTQSATPVSNGRVGARTDAPNSTLHVAGSFAGAITTVSANTTLGESNYAVLVNASGGARTITLPSASGLSGRFYVIKKIDSSANAVTVNTTSAQTIDGATSVNLTTQWQTLRVQTDGSSWFAW